MVLSTCGREMPPIGVDKLCTFPNLWFFKRRYSLLQSCRWNGDERNIPRHGLVRKKEFELVEQIDKSVTFAIEDDEKAIRIILIIFALKLLM